MRTAEVLAATDPDAPQRPPQIASWKHLMGFLLIGTGLVALGLLAQHAPTDGASTGQLGHHSQAIPNLHRRNSDGLGSPLLLLERGA
jgi:hypothetical protein